MQAGLDFRHGNRFRLSGFVRFASASHHGVLQYREEMIEVRESRRLHYFANA
ncbi:hypothetical protein D3C83_213260 [compost metagenome]